MNGVYEAESVDTDEMIQTCNAIPEKKIRKMEFETGFEYVQENLPNEMNPDRVVTEYVSVIFEQQTREIKASVKDVIQLENGDHIVFL
jgi:G:T-mismatch repair DNA endonuclease (very short patch repair protein)